jgi:hypothetical protein
MILKARRDRSPTANVRVPSGFLLDKSRFAHPGTMVSGAKFNAQAPAQHNDSVDS